MSQIGWLLKLMARSGWFLLSFGVAVAPAVAQIKPDRTLGNQRSVVERRTVRQRPADVISGGAVRGESNLFHSFREFNVENGQRVYFANPSGIENIFARVTGNNRSTIRGVLGVDGSANLFLLNPHGILFGRNASLDLRGSFLATTASSIVFNDNAQFRADGTQTESLLRVSVPVGLQFGSNPGSIINQSAHELSEDLVGEPFSSNDTFVGLKVAEGQTLALVGGDLVLDGGEVTAPAGRIELGSVASDDRVDLNQTARGWTLGYGKIQDFGDIQFANIADVDASGIGGGAIRIWGDQVLSSGGSLIRSSTFGDQNGQGISIHADQLKLDGADTLIVARTFGTGRGGDVRLRADQVTIEDGAFVGLSTAAAGDSGSLFITADQIDLSGFVRSQGEPATDGGFPFPSGLFVRVAEGATGRGGNVSIVTNQLSVTEGAQVSASTVGAGNPPNVERTGRITIRAADIELAGVVLSSQGEPLTAGDGSTFPSSISTFTNSERRAGDIRITTDRLSLRDGATLQTSTQSSGNAGNLTLRATDQIDIAGTAPGLDAPTGLLAFSGGIAGSDLKIQPEADATGRGGRLDIISGDVKVRDGAVVAVGSSNPTDNDGEAGSLRIQAEDLSLANGAQLTAASESVDGGNIRLQLSDLLTLENSSTISASAGNDQTGGNGGNVTIDAAFILAAPVQNSDIIANAFAGSGGNITLNAEGVLGLEERKATPANSTNDIDASSEFGAPGTVTINSPAFELIQEPSTLPDTPVRSELAQGCQVNQATTAAFFNTGRGGLSISPYEPLSGSDILSDLRLPEQPPDQLTDQPTDRPTEAKSWRVNADGQVVLVAESPEPRHCSFR